MESVYLYNLSITGRIARPNPTMSMNFTLTSLHWSANYASGCPVADILVVPLHRKRCRTHKEVYCTFFQYDNHLMTGPRVVSKGPSMFLNLEVTGKHNSLFFYSSQLKNGKKTAKELFAWRWLANQMCSGFKCKSLFPQGVCEFWPLTRDTFFFNWKM